MTRELTVAASLVRSFLEFAISKGASQRSLVERSGIDTAMLLERDQRIPFHRYVCLMRAGKELCNDPALALHFGEEVDCSEMSVPIGGAEGIGGALAIGNRYTRVTVDVDTAGSGERFSLRVEAGQLWMIDNRTNPNDFPELTESSFARMVSSTRRIVGNASFLKAVRVTHARPSYWAEYERILGAPVVFGSDRNGLQIDEALIAAVRLPSQPPYVTDVLREHADGLLRKLDSSLSTQGRVENVLMPILHTVDVSVNKVSKELGLSRQTLFRKLKAEGVTFQQVLDQLRKRLALHYLISEKKSLQRTACLVGFSDVTAFSRAFKRWTGARPRAYVDRETARL